MHVRCAAAVTIVTVRVGLLGEPWVVCFYSSQPGGLFLLAQASVSYASIALSSP